jgi:hypothetical protein
MPNERVFEAVNVQDYIMGLMTGQERPSKKLNMYEVAESYYKQIQHFMKMLETDKTVCYEHAGTNHFYRWQRKGVDRFAMQVLMDGHEPQTFIFRANDVLNTIFKHVPFMALVGTEADMSLQAEE